MADSKRFKKIHSLVDRAKAYEPASLNGAPATFKAMDYKAPDLRGLKFTIQVAPEDCTGCNLCIPPCPVDCIDIVAVGTPT